MPQHDPEVCLKIVEQLLNALRLERLVYLIISSVSLVILLVTIVFMWIGDRLQPLELVGLFASSGGISYSLSGLLRMWSDSLKFIAMMGGRELGDGND